MTKILGGWSQSLTLNPFDEFDTMMYGMVTNLDGLTTGTAAYPGWSPEREPKPSASPTFNGKTLWSYGGGLCSPEQKPANAEDVSRIVAATINKNWDGVDFDDECNMNIPLIIEAMRQLKQNNKETSYGFPAGWWYNHPETSGGKKISETVQAFAASGQCDRLVHYCYANAMWDESLIRDNVRQSLQRSISNGMEKSRIILALTTNGLTDWNLNYFIDQIIDLDVGGLFIWRYDEISRDHLKMIKQRLGK
ncbi:Glyco-hydro-18 domain-containing protein [Acetobacteraceae bacterium EV16G]|uniref:Glyco-hydro-18 domain-containing protein n=1 Tax=Sorlinia euscelidii TaxID=3081148 RepID=A0ABU7U5S2_9PROT